MHNTYEFTARIWKLAQGGSDPEVQDHINTCPRCREEFETLRSLNNLKVTADGDLAALRTEQTSALSALLEKYGPVGRAPQTQHHSVLTKLKTIWAEMLHDTGNHVQLAGLRSGASTGTRQVAFVSDVADLDLEITAVDQLFSVVGQVGLDSIPSGLNITFIPSGEDPLVPNPDRVISSSIDDHGYFNLNVQPGVWVASLEMEDAVVLFPGVEL